MINFEYLKKLPKTKKQTSKVIIMLHWFGSNMYDLFWLNSYFNEDDFLFSLNWITKMWFNQNCRYMADFSTQIPKYDFEDVKNAKSYISDFIDYLKNTYEIDGLEIYLLGFSQGWIMSFFCLNEIENISWIIGLSTRLLDEQKHWEVKNISKDKKVFLWHWNFDLVIKSEKSLILKEYLEKNSVIPTYKTYNMDHTIIWEEIEDILEFLG